MGNTEGVLFLIGHAVQRMANWTRRFWRTLRADTWQARVIYQHV